MKTLVSFVLAATVLSMSQATLAKTEKVVRSDRISFNVVKTQASKKVEPVQRTDRIKFNAPTMEQPQLQPKRVVRSDRIAFNQI